MHKSNQFFASANPMRLFLIVALPGLVSMLAASLYNAFEGAFVGQWLGEVAFAAVNIGFPIVMINFALADLIGVGSSVLISVALGKNDEKSASNIFTCSLILIVFTGLITGALIYFSAPFFIGLMKPEGDLVNLGISYIRIFAIFSPVTTIVFATDNYLRISGFVKGSMMLNIFMSCLTIAFLFLFIVVFGMDVSGSALASCVAMFTCAIIAIIPFLLGKSILKLCRPVFCFSMIRDIVMCGMPVFLNNISGRVTAIIMNATLFSLGKQTAVATYAVLMYAAGLIEPMLYGMCDSISPAVGYNWGAGAIKRVRDIVKCCFLICGILSLICTVLLMAFPSFFVGIFVNGEKDSVLVESAIPALRLFATAFATGWVGFAVQGFFAAIEKPLPATVLSISRALVFPVILIYALSFMGLDGLWLNYSMTSVLTAIMAVIMIFFIQKKINKECKFFEEDIL